MTTANPYSTKNTLAHLSNSLQPNTLQANTLTSGLSPHGLGRQVVASSAQSDPFRRSI